MLRRIFPVLALFFLLWSSARAYDAVDYSTYPTFYEQKLSNSPASSIARSGNLLLSLHNSTITVWDFSDFSNPVRRSYLLVEQDAYRLIALRGEFYLLTRYLEYTTLGFISSGGHLDWIDVSNPASPISVQLNDTGYVEHTAVWGDNLVFDTYGQYCGIPSNNCWLGYRDTQIRHFISPTLASSVSNNLNEEDDFAGNGSMLWVIRNNLLTAYPSATSFQEGIQSIVPLGSELVSAHGDRAWVRISSSTIEEFRADPDALVSAGQFDSVVADEIDTVIPWQDGFLALGKFGVQTFGPRAGPAPIWRVAQSAAGAVTQDDRAWVVSDITGFTKILLDPPVETPLKIGELDTRDTRLNLSSDGHFLFTVAGTWLDTIDLQASGGPQVTIQTNTGQSSSIKSVSVQDDCLALVYPAEIQLYRYDPANGLPTYETSIIPQVTAREGAFADSVFVVLSANEGLEIHGLGEGTPVLGSYNAGNLTNLSQLHLDSDMAWFVSGAYNAYEFDGVSIAQAQAPELMADIPIGKYTTVLSVDHDDIVMLQKSYTLHAYHYEDGVGVTDLGDLLFYLSPRIYGGVLLKDGILNTDTQEEMRVYEWNGGSPTLLGFQEGTGTGNAVGMIAQGPSLVVQSKAEAYPYHVSTHIYLAQKHATPVPVLLESFEVRPTEMRRQLLIELGASLQPLSLKLLAVKDGVESELPLEHTSATQFQAWDELRTHEVTYRLLEKQTDGSWIVLHEEQVAGSTLSWIGPKVLQNPSIGSLDVAFAQPRSGRVTIDVIDLAGRRVARLQSGVLPSGLHNFQWDGRDASGRAVARGVYFLRSQSGGHVSSTKFTLVR